MFTIHKITVIFIAFFMLYSAVGKENTVNNKKIVNLKRKIDVQIARWILSMKRKSFHEINELSYATLKKWKYVLMILCFIPLMVRPCWTTINIFNVCFLIIIFISLGLVSFSRLANVIKIKFIENLKFIILIITFIAIISMTDRTNFNLLVKSMNQSVDRFYSQVSQLHVFQTETISPWGLTGLSFGFLLIAALFAYIIIRPLTKGTLWIMVSFAKFCFWLNYKSPLKPFYLIGQVLTVVLSELLTKALN